ncbi:2Fe-2S iron-sulfur cluster-binding protein [Umezawaea sp. Da 62-37]|uniref:2Fe-2S iron-sulfur cluster-binding protein n=1 Tax=Umezawaea sp. Da 62-37 TaxID=3075927 RepID=UPI0028F6CC5A|nr:2Fe-2S iron-sulfur cluster-binding protein [Umezawaea sp. Da 62-37]WNV85091.1 2Fe-2S iron-sulfur cluster-binding protein [Umezawaea sp. Da 62-37]
MKVEKLTILPTGVEVLLPSGSPLTEVEYETRQRLIPFGCRSGACGACVIEVLEGLESLGDPDHDEVDFLEDLGRTGGDYRLACQCRLRGDATIRPAAED